MFNYNRTIQSYVSVFPTLYHCISIRISPALQLPIIPSISPIFHAMYYVLHTFVLTCALSWHFKPFERRVHFCNAPLSPHDKAQGQTVAEDQQSVLLPSLRVRYNKEWPYITRTQFYMYGTHTHTDSHQHMYVMHVCNDRKAQRIELNKMGAFCYVAWRTREKRYWSKSIKSHAYH